MCSTSCIIDLFQSLSNMNASGGSYKAAPYTSRRDPDVVDERVSATEAAWAQPHICHRKYSFVNLNIDVISPYSMKVKNLRE